MRVATHIMWDTEQDIDLPTEVEIPDYIDDDRIPDYLSDLTGFCHNGYIIRRKEENSMILTKKQIDELPFDTCQQLLDVLYTIEDQLNYKCESVSATINYLQNELHPVKEDGEA